MSTERRRKGTFSTSQPRGPAGQRLCYWCKKPVSPPRRTFCSQACVHEWKLRTDPSYVRRCVLARDRGICALCKVDTIAVRRAFVEACKAAIGEAMPRRRRYWLTPQPEIIAIEERLKTLGFDLHRKTYWDADHVVRVVDGGGQCGLDGYRTLCQPCHKKVSAEQRQP